MDKRQRDDLLTDIFVWIEIMICMVALILVLASCTPQPYTLPQDPCWTIASETTQSHLLRVVDADGSVRMYILEVKGKVK